MVWEYKVIPAPSKGKKARGIKAAAGRFAHALELELNTQALDGWEFWRAETLPSDERTGLTGSQTVWRHVMVFRRPKTSDMPDTVSAPVALITDETNVADTQEDQGIADAPVEEFDDALRDDAADTDTAQESVELATEDAPEPQTEQDDDKRD